MFKNYFNFIRLTGNTNFIVNRTEIVHNEKTDSFSHLLEITANFFFVVFFYVLNFILWLFRTHATKKILRMSGKALLK